MLAVVRIQVLQPTQLSGLENDEWGRIEMAVSNRGTGTTYSTQQEHPLEYRSIYGSQSCPYYMITDSNFTIYYILH